MGVWGLAPRKGAGGGEAPAPLFSPSPSGRGLGVGRRILVIKTCKKI